MVFAFCAVAGSWFNPPVARAEVSSLGSIQVCKLMENASGTIVDGSAFPGQDFSVSGIVSVPSTTAAAEGLLPTSVFTTPLALNTKLLGSATNNARCVTYVVFPSAITIMARK